MEVILKYQNIEIKLRQLSSENTKIFNKKVVFCCKKLFEGYSQERIEVLSSIYALKLIEGKTLKYNNFLEEELKDEQF